MRYEGVKSPWLAVSPGLWVAVNTSASHNWHCPEQIISYFNWLEY